MHQEILLKKDLTNLYGSGLSMMQIAKRMNCSIHKVVYWMDKFGINRRSFSDAVYLTANPDGDPFTIKTILTDDERVLFGLGLGIYWGEGERVSKGRVRVANTDPYLLIVFRDFLLKICQVTLGRIRYNIICFNDSNPQEALQYWSQLLEISEAQFGKIVQIAPQGKGTYKKKSKFGICIIEISNTKLKSWLMNELISLNALPR